MYLGIVFRGDVSEFRMQCSIAFARQARITLIDLDEGISFMEVGVVIITGQPAGGGVANLIGLGSEGLVLDKAAEWFCVSELLIQMGMFLHLHPIPFRNNVWRSYRSVEIPDSRLPCPVSLYLGTVPGMHSWRRIHRGRCTRRICWLLC